MSEERPGQDPGERDDLDELLDRDEDEGAPEEGDDLDLGEGGEEGGEEEPPEQPPQSRTRQRRAERKSEAQELREQNRRLIDVLTRQPAPQYQQPAQVDPARQAQLDREEREMVAQKPYDEQIAYWREKDRREFQQHLMLSGLQTRDMLDRNHFQQIVREERLPARYATEVEDRLSQARRNNMNPTREQVLNEMLGAEFRARKGREVERQRARGQRRIASQTTRPSGTGSTAASGGGRRNQNQDADDEAALRGVTLGDVWNSA